MLTRAAGRWRNEAARAFPVGASPVRGAVYGGAGEKLDVQVTVEHAVWHSPGGGSSQAQSVQ